MPLLPWSLLTGGFVLVFIMDLTRLVLIERILCACVQGVVLQEGRKTVIVIIFPACATVLPVTLFLFDRMMWRNCVLFLHGYFM